MTECWSEGEWRAYLDRELAPAERERAALHLAECAECGRVAAELERRGLWVAGLVGELRDSGQTERPRRHWKRWVAAAAAVAAGIAIAAVVLPQREQLRAPVAPETSTVAEVPVPAVPAATVAVPVVTQARTPVPRRGGRRAAVRDDGFVRLDDEPFETGVVFRVALGPAAVPADVVFGSDGRARAIRLVEIK